MSEQRDSFMGKKKDKNSKKGKKLQKEVVQATKTLESTEAALKLHKKGKKSAPKAKDSKPKADVTKIKAQAPSKKAPTSLQKKPLKKTILKPGKSGKFRILFVASECEPFAKTGGLADVVSALPRELKRQGHDVRIIIPFYDTIDPVRYNIKFRFSSCIHMGKGEENWVGIHEGMLYDEVPVMFVDYSRFFKRGAIYGDIGGEYQDNAFRFGLLSKAALQVCKDLAWTPHVMHLHDWPTSLTATFLKTWDRILSPLSHTASVLTIHNMGYQGKFHASAFTYIGLGGEYFNGGVIEDFGGLNLLKAGIHFADAITTVSPTYAKEILGPIGGCGLDSQLLAKKDDLFGILNGVDYTQWNPETDKFITATYSINDMRGKAKCKFELQKRLGLITNPHIPLFGIISRIADQKGFDLIEEALPRALDAMDMQFCLLGSGDTRTEDFFRSLEHRFRGRVGVYIGYNNELSHMIEAGSDFFLMPSLYEPCGLNQMYSLRYGTLPIVRAIGGLNDTVENYDEATGQGTGFKFNEISAWALYNTIGWAISTWFDRPHHIESLRRNAMERRFTWEHSAKEYVHVYERAIKNRANYS